MRHIFLRAASLILTLTFAVPLHADLGVVQETSFTAQFQTVQAANYWGSYQISMGAQWTLGLDWDRWATLRGGLSARAVQTSPVVSNTVYPGYQGWGWTAAFDAVPWRTEGWGAEWGLGFTAAIHWEFLSYPGLYREFTLPGATAALLGEVVPGGTSGLRFRFRVPVGVDQRDRFWLSWRAGFEAAVVFRGVGWNVP